MKRDHRENVVGPWASQKLDALEKYLEFYNTALKNQRFQRVYIDAFAGSPRARIRQNPDVSEPNVFLDALDGSIAQEQYDSIDQEQFIMGSPMRALNLKEGFHKHYFFDMDESRVSTISELSSGRNDVICEVGDSNPIIQRLAPQLKRWNIRGVAFLDPYGAHLHWSTLESLAQTGTMEVIINFPVAMAINRLIKRNGDIPITWQEQLDLCFGTTEWRDISYSVETDLFGEEVISKNKNNADALLNLYHGKLENIFSYVSGAHLIRNTRGVPLYYLIWAGPNELGLKVAKHILRQGEKVR